MYPLSYYDTVFLVFADPGRGSLLSYDALRVAILLRARISVLGLATVCRLVQVEASRQADPSSGESRRVS
jgi:hypothetical protein